MQILDSGSTPTARLITPAVERVTAWHREHSMRQARAAFEALHDDEQENATGDASVAARSSVESPAGRAASAAAR